MVMRYLSFPFDYPEGPVIDFYASPIATMNQFLPAVTSEHAEKGHQVQLLFRRQLSSQHKIEELHGIL